MIPKIIEPSILSLITTYQCTAACEDCCFGCSPKKKDTLSTMRMKELIVKITTTYPTVRLVVLTGGECFTIKEDLFDLLSFIHGRGLFSRIITNGSWANTQVKADKIVNKLLECGLTEINFSTGDSHQKFVPIEHLVNGIVACQKQNLMTVINVETHDAFAFKVDDLKNNERIIPYLTSPKLKIISGIWITDKKQPKNDITFLKDKILKKQAKRCTELFSTIAISPNDDFFCCCGLTINKVPFLNLGKIGEKDIKTIWESQFQDFVKIWLFAEGPKKILDFVKTIDSRIKINTKSMHICEICQAILTNDQALTIIRNNYKRVLSRVLLEYTTQLKLINS